MLLDACDEREPPVEAIEQLAVERRDLCAELGQVGMRVHARSVPAGANSPWLGLALFAGYAGGDRGGRGAARAPRHVTRPLASVL